MPEFHLHRGTAASVGVGACAKKVNLILDISADGEVELRVLAGGGMCYSVGCRPGKTPSLFLTSMLQAKFAVNDERSEAGSLLL